MAADLLTCRHVIAGPYAYVLWARLLAKETSALKANHLCAGQCANQMVMIE